MLEWESSWLNYFLSGLFYYFTVGRKLVNLLIMGSFYTKGVVGDG
jgi:hypothetical protein